MEPRLNFAVYAPLSVGFDVPLILLNRLFWVLKNCDSPTPKNLKGYAGFVIHLLHLIKLQILSGDFR